MAVVVLKVIALIFQRIERLIFNLPPRPATTHELIDVPLTHPQVRHPAEVLDHVLADLPILKKLTRTSDREALSGTSFTKRNRCTTPAARSYRSYLAMRPASSAACTCLKRYAWSPAFTPRI